MKLLPIFVLVLFISLVSAQLAVSDTLTSTIKCDNVAKNIPSPGIVLHETECSFLSKQGGSYLSSFIFDSKDSVKIVKAYTWQDSSHTIYSDELQMVEHATTVNASSFKESSEPCKWGEGKEKAEIDGFIYCYDSYKQEGNSITFISSWLTTVSVPHQVMMKEWVETQPSASKAVSYTKDQEVKMKIIFSSPSESGKFNVGLGSDVLDPYWNSTSPAYWYFDYWIADDSSAVWVKLNQTDSFYVYGNGTTARSSIDSTFIEGDDFNANGFNTSKWIIVGSITVTQNGSGSMRYDTGAHSSKNGLHWNGLFTENAVMIVGKFMDNNGCAGDCRTGIRLNQTDGTTYKGCEFQAQVPQYEAKFASAQAYAGTWIDNTWIKAVYADISTKAVNCSYILGNGSSFDLAETDTTLIKQIGITNGGKGTMDYIFLANGANVNPTIAYGTIENGNWTIGNETYTQRTQVNVTSGSGMTDQQIELNITKLPSGVNLLASNESGNTAPTSGLISPDNNTVLTNTTWTFAWFCNDSSEDLNYTLYIDGNPASNGSCTDETECSANVDDIVPITHQWFVECSDGELSTNSSVFWFTGVSYNLTQCEDILIPGTYLFQDNISSSDTQFCIHIQSDDVTIDGNGYAITGEYDNAYAAISASNQDNITIRNIVQSASYWGADINACNNTMIRDSTFFDNVYAGVEVLGGTNGNMENVESSYAELGIYYYVMDGGSLSNISAHDSETGIYIYQSSNLGLSEIFTYGNTGGEGYGYGLESYGDNMGINDNITINSLQSWNNDYGVFLSDSNNTVLSSSHFYSNTNADLILGAYSYDGIINNISNAYIDNPTGDYTNFTDLSIVDSLVSGDLYMAIWSPAPSTPPENTTSFHDKYVEITTLTGSPVIDTIIFGWASIESSGHNESSFRLYDWEGADWTDTLATLNETDNSLTLTNWGAFSVFGIFEGYTDNPPVISLVTPLENATINSSSFIFNVTDDISTVLDCAFFINGFFVDSNNSVENNTNTNFTAPLLPPGNYNWTVECYDDYPNLGISETRNFTVASGPIPVAINLSYVMWTAYSNYTIVGNDITVNDTGTYLLEYVSSQGLSPLVFILSPAVLLLILFPIVWFFNKI